MGYLKWHVPSTPQENQLLLRHQRKLWPPSLRPPRPRVVSRELTDSDQEPLLLDTSENTRNLPSSSLENSHSRDSLDISPTTSKLTRDSNLQPSLLSKKPPKPTWSDFSRTPTFAPSMPRESPLCQRTCNLPRESEVRDHENCVKQLSMLKYLTFICHSKSIYSQ